MRKAHNRKELPDKQICDEYLSGVSSTQLGLKYGVTPATILLRLRENNVCRRSNNENNPLQLNEYEVCADYNSGLSVKQISHKYQVSESTVNRYLRNNNVSRRRRVPHNKKYTEEYVFENIIPRYMSGESLKSICDDLEIPVCSIQPIVSKYVKKEDVYDDIYNTDFFKEIDCGDKAYVLGFFITDGHLGNGGIEWKLSVVDESILRKISIKILNKDAVHTSVCRFKGNDFPTARLCIRNKKIESDLKNIISVENKTSDVRIPDIPAHLHKDLLRGIFDGDGTITKYGSLFLCGNKHVVEGVIQILEQHFGHIDYKYIIDKRRPEWYISVNIHKKSSIPIMKWMYSGNIDLYLDRKKQKAECFYNE